MTSPRIAVPARSNAVRQFARWFVNTAWSALWLLVSIALGAVVHRTLSYIIPMPAGPPGAAGFDAGFAAKPVLTLAHIWPGLVFLLLAPVQFMRSVRGRRPALHRWMGRVLIAAGLMTGITALPMSFVLPIGGVNETAATVTFALLFLFALVRVFVNARHRNFVVHREWAIRAFAIGLAIATIRPITGAFFATSRLTGLTPHEFFGTAFWIGFMLHLVAAEVYINATRGTAIASDALKMKPVR